MENSPQYLYLASGIKNGEGFWIVGVKNCDENILEDKNLLDCHRKELIGYQSAKDILFAIKLNIDNLLHELKNKNYLIESPSLGISFDIPLDVLESIEKSCKIDALGLPEFTPKLPKSSPGLPKSTLGPWGSQNRGLRGDPK